MYKILQYNIYIYNIFENTLLMCISKYQANI